MLNNFRVDVLEKFCLERLYKEGAGEEKTGFDTLKGNKKLVVKKFNLFKTKNDFISSENETNLLLEKF